MAGSVDLLSRVGIHYLPGGVSNVVGFCPDRGPHMDRPTNSKPTGPPMPDKAFEITNEASLSAALDEVYPCKFMSMNYV